MEKSLALIFFRTNTPVENQGLEVPGLRRPHASGLQGSIPRFLLQSVNVLYINSVL